MLLLLLGGDVSLNPGPLTPGVVNARSVSNKGLLLADTFLQMTLTFSALLRFIYIPLIEIAFYRL